MREVDDLERAMQGARGVPRPPFGPVTLQDARSLLVAEHAARLDREFCAVVFGWPSPAEQAS